MTIKKTRRLIVAICATMVGLAACGSEPPPIATPTEPPTEEPTDVAQEAAASADPGDAANGSVGGVVAVTSADSPLGEILVGANGLAIYGFTNDNNATSNCYGRCAADWPPVIVGADWDVAPGLDSAIFNAFSRDDGQLQLVAGKWPLYYFAGDVLPTDLKGQGSGDVWFAIGTDGALITDQAPAESADSASAQPAADQASDGEAVTAAGGPAVTAPSPLGDILVDDAGLSLYGFLNDDQGTPTCEDGCADAWPPLFVDSAELPAGLDGTVFSVVERPDGTFQLKAGNWPLYRFAGDAGPGELNGQGSGDVWFVAAPDGSLIRDGVDADGQEEGSAAPPAQSPAPTAQPAQPPVDGAYGG